MASLTKAKLGDIKFMLNPSAITWDSGAVWTEVNSPGMPTPYQVYSYGKPDTLSFEMFMYQRFDEGFDISYVVNKLNEYRKSKQTIIFNYGGFAGRVLITECPITYEGQHRNLKPSEVRIPITLIRV